MHRNSIILRLAAIFIMAGMGISACSPKQARMGGIVRGVIYADMNGNGYIEADETSLNGAVVSMSDCGPIVTLTTAVDGAFNFTNLPEGTCHVSVAKTGWTFSGSNPSLGYPIPVASNPDLPTEFSIFLAPLSQLEVSTPVPSENTPTVPPEEAISTFAGPPTDTPTEVSTEPMLAPFDKDVNCRFGPSMAFLSVGFLRLGQTVPIYGTSPDHGWWQIQNPQDIAGHYCWVGGTVVQTFGDLSLVKVVKVPVGQVTAVTVSATSFIHTTCGTPAGNSIDGSITTNGPTTVTYHWEFYVKGGGLLGRTSDQFLTFTSAGTKHQDPGSNSRDCGSYTAKLIISSPNNLSAQASWDVVEP